VANTRSALKRIRQARRSRVRNLDTRSAIKTMVKKTVQAAEAGDESAGQHFSDTSSLLDKAAKRGIIHKNSANRRKGSLARRLRAAAETE